MKIGLHIKQNDSASIYENDINWEYEVFNSIADAVRTADKYIKYTRVIECELIIDGKVVEVIK